ncbi:MAG: 4-diphosphocytidyl-2-C-methyl-D-erythritol kinase [Isosphaeraceae bacterium]|nr:MAG: 4-diphosphocytidyl-2-C-methyl-D-erythritol kinase [Isosphaeraceae bacterium]
MIVREIPDGIEALAPAKLNLFLEVHGKRADGYHELETLMVAVDWYDTLRFRSDPSGAIALVSDDPDLPIDRSNLVVRAAEVLQEAIGIRSGAAIRLTKRIPAQSGLGGGSSDAAATLVALNRLWSCGLDLMDLERLGAGLGSDVPFFLRGGAAVCRGRGEQVEPIAIPRPLHFVIVRPAVGVSTAEVYRRFERTGPIHPMEESLKAWRQVDIARLGRSLFNRLQETAERLVPELTQVRDALKSLGSLIDGQLMSGSGSAYFGLCRDRETAQAVARHFETLGQGSVRAVMCGPLERDSTP